VGDAQDAASRAARVEAQRETLLREGGACFYRGDRKEWPTAAEVIDSSVDANCGCKVHVATKDPLFLHPHGASVAFEDSYEHSFENLSQDEEFVFLHVNFADK